MSSFKRRHRRTGFGRSLVATHERWCADFEASDRLDRPHVVALTSASAGAVEAVGGYGSAMRKRFGSAAVEVGASDHALHDHIAEFAQALDDERSVEAAYRVVTWAVLAELAVFFWQPNYDLEMAQCADVFGMDNLFEETVAAVGRPVHEDAPKEEVADRVYELIKGSLYGMVSAAIGRPIEPDDGIVNMHLPGWADHFIQARKVAGERLADLAPEGLPIWGGMSRQFLAQVREPRGPARRPVWQHEVATPIPLQGMEATTGIRHVSQPGRFRRVLFDPVDYRWRVLSAGVGFVVGGAAVGDTKWGERPRFDRHGDWCCVCAAVAFGIASLMKS